MFNLYTCKKTDSIRTVLSKIDKNKEGFLVVCNNGIVDSIVTDGDIRRGLLSGFSLDDCVIKFSNSKFDYLTIASKFEHACELFALSKNKFLPILDSKNLLVNIITRQQFNDFMLNDNDFNINENFVKLNSPKTIETISNRPWGFYISTFLSPHCQAKILTIFPASETSLQYHKNREEHWVVVKGNGAVIKDNKMHEVKTGDYIYIQKEEKHRLINNSNSNFIISEIQIGSYFGEDDIVRMEDKYGRI